ncbi:unnamed protein product [Ectocarpus sp. CCAP 1310/34]|nr:unnamed protein product [Ectocarpus sp. CCAP 1310/34]
MAPNSMRLGRWLSSMRNTHNKAREPQSPFAHGGLDGFLAACLDEGLGIGQGAV